MLTFLVYRCYGTRQSLAAWDKQRINRSFEKVNDAESRSREKSLKEKRKQRTTQGVLERRLGIRLVSKTK